jgi:hypothetical protein
MIDPRGYWLTNEGYTTHTFDEKLAKAIFKTFKKAKTAIDIGCGDGRYTKYLIDNGIETKGYDGNPLTPQISNNLCGVKDFSFPVNLGKFDLALSLEVGEHIPKQFEKVFLDNVTYAATKYICLSWAVFGQPGYGHFNCQNNDYIITELLKRGFIINTQWSQDIRDHSTLPWFKDTVMAFEKF